jgi:hypothetical protein
VTINYTYDPLYRLTAAEYSDGKFYHYAYDSVGNRLTQQSHLGNDTYIYDNANRLASVNGGVTRASDPVTWGVPLAQSFGVTSPDQLQLTDQAGHAVPAQFTVTARWGGAPDDSSKPVKWILADFQANVAANSSAVYHLKNGTSPAHPTPIVVNESASGYEINTGRARFVISKTSFHLFDQIYVDRNGDSKLDDLVLAAPGRIEAAVQGVNYYADTSQPQETALELSGPLHTVLRLRGWLKDASGAHTLLAYTARLHFYAGTETARLEFTVWNDNVMTNLNGQPDIKEFGSPHTVLFDDLTIRLQLANPGAPAYTLAGISGQTYGGTLTGAASLYQDSSGGQQWQHAPDNSLNTLRGFQADANGSVLHPACDESAASDECRSQGWAGLSANGAGIQAGVRYFWENYPKEITLQSNGTVAVGLFPARYGTPFELRVGEQKTHEILFYFGPENVAQTMTALHHPMQAWASSEYYLNEAKVFDRVNPNASANPNFTDYEGYVDAGVLNPQFNLFIVREGGVGSNWVYSPRPESWGWRNFGDVIAEDETNADNWPVFTNLQYDHPWGSLVQAVRASSRDKNLTAQWWYLTESGALHTADVDIVHSRCTGQSLADMQVCTDQAVPYPVGWAMGGRLTNQWHAWPVPNIHRNSAIDYWSGGIRGMLNYYYFTGNGMVKDSWNELAENARWRIQNSACDPDCGPGYANNNPGQADGRLAAYGLEIMTDAYNATGDPAYLSAAQHVVTASNPDLTWFGQPGYFPNPNVSGSGNLTGPWILGLIMKSLGNYLDMTVEWTGQPDSAAQDSLLRYAQLQTSWWRLGEQEPTCYTIYENGGCSRDFSAVFLPDGLAWALIYNDGRLNTSTTVAVAADAWQKSLNEPWGPDYPKNEFMTSKQHALQNINGTAWMWYAIHCTNGATEAACNVATPAPKLNLSASSHNFGDQPINTTSSAFTLTITNTGTADLHLGALSLTGPFALVNNQCNGQTLAPAGACTFGVTFTPASVGAASGSVSVPSDAASNPDSAALSGAGTSSSGGANLLLNAGFDQTSLYPKAWVYSAPGKAFSTLVDCTVFLSPSCSLKLAGERTSRTVTQNVSASGNAGDQFTFGLSGKALNIPAGGAYKVEVSFYRANRVLLTKTLYFTNGTHDFESLSKTIAIPGAYTKIVFRITLQKGSGTAWFEDAFLIKLP